jgi:hypothetical protein
VLENDIFIKIDKLYSSDTLDFSEDQVESIKDQVRLANFKNMQKPLILQDGDTEVGYIRCIESREGQLWIFILFNDSWAANRCRQLLETVPCGIVATVLRRAHKLAVRRFILIFQNIIVEDGKFFIQRGGNKGSAIFNSPVKE